MLILICLFCNICFQKFFGTVREAAGSNDHPTCATFLQLYKLLSVYSIFKPPKYGNCTSEAHNTPQILITLSELKEIYGTSESKTSTTLKHLRERLDISIRCEEWEADEVIEHDYNLATSIDCIIYYVTGYFNDAINIMCFSTAFLS